MKLYQPFSITLTEPVLHQQIVTLSYKPALYTHSMYMHCTCIPFMSNIHVPNAATIEYEAELRHKNEMARVEAEIKGK